MGVNAVCYLCGAADARIQRMMFRRHLGAAADERVFVYPLDAHSLEYASKQGSKAAVSH